MVFFIKAAKRDVEYDMAKEKAIDKKQSYVL